jgi:hypothetical protein
MTTFFCLTLGVSLMAIPVNPNESQAQGPKSKVQKEIQKESEAKQRKKDQQELNRINNDLSRQREWRKKNGPNADSVTTEKANDRTRELAGRKQQIEKRMNPPKEKPPTQTGSDRVKQQNQREQKTLERNYRTFGQGNNARQPRR